MNDYIDIKEEMQYNYKNDDTPSRVLATGRYKGIYFCVVNHHGMHPNGYVEVTGTRYDDKEYYNKLGIESRKIFWKDHERQGYYNAETEIDCHGGVTFSDGFCFGEYEPKIEDEVTRWFIGWDYAHSGDFIAGRPYEQGKKIWTTEKVVRACKNVIDQIYGDKDDKD